MPGLKKQNPNHQYSEVADAYEVTDNFGKHLGYYERSTRSGLHGYWYRLYDATKKEYFWMKDRAGCRDYFDRNYPENFQSKKQNPSSLETVLVKELENSKHPVYKIFSDDNKYLGYYKKVENNSYVIYDAIKKVYLRKYDINECKEYFQSKKNPSSNNIITFNEDGQLYVSVKAHDKHEADNIISSYSLKKNFNYRYEYTDGFVDHSDKKHKVSFVYKVTSRKNPSSSSSSQKNQYYVDWDDITNSWGVFNTETTKMYSSWATKEQALEDMKNRNYIRKNPSIEENEATELFEEFRGRKPLPEEQYDIDEIEEEPDNLAELGKVIEIGILTGEKHETPIHVADNEDGNLILAADPKTKQLYIIGVANLDNILDELNIPENVQSKRKIDIGEAVSITYEADKQQFDDDVKEGAYWYHVFGEDLTPKGRENFNKIRTKLKQGKSSLPVLVYDRTNKKLELVGGSYHIDSSGIRN